MRVYRGYVKNGEIVLYEPHDLPEGTPVLIKIVQLQEEASAEPNRTSDQKNADASPGVD